MLFGVGVNLWQNALYLSKSGLSSIAEVDLENQTLTVKVISVKHDNSFSLALNSITLHRENQNPVVTQDLMSLVGTPISPNLVVDATPGIKSFADGQIISALSEPLVPDVVYEVGVNVDSIDAGVGLYYAANGGSPFESPNPSGKVGQEIQIKEAKDTDTVAVLRKSGTDSINVSALSVRVAQWTIDLSSIVGGYNGSDRVTWEIQSGEVKGTGSTYIPTSGIYYVSPQTSGTGNGARELPMTITQALEAVQPNETIRLMKGRHRPFQISDTSGLNSNPIILEPDPDIDASLVTVEGDLALHTMAGGTGIGVPTDFNNNLANRHGLFFERCNYWTIRNLNIRGVWGNGIQIVGGSYGNTYGNFIITGNTIEDTGSSSILVQGKPGTDRLLNTETTHFIQDVTFTSNTCRRSNQPNDYFNHIEGVTGSDTEMVSFVWGVDTILVGSNDLRDGANYCIDFKAGVSNFTCTDNIVKNFRKYGIYCDTANLWVTNGDISGNTISECQIGIAMSREAAPIPEYADYATAKAALGSEFFQQTLDSVDAYNNIIFDCEEAGIRCERHPTKDGPDGSFNDVRFRFNTLADNNRSVTAKDLFLGGWFDEDMVSAGIATGIDFSANLISNSTDDIDITDEFSGKVEASVVDNFNLADGPETAPLFNNVAGDDYSLIEASSTVGTVTTAGLIDGKFALDKNDDTRRLPTSPGAVARHAIDAWSLASGDGQFTITFDEVDLEPFTVAAGNGQFTITWSGGMVRKFVHADASEITGSYPDAADFTIVEGTSPLVVTASNGVERVVGAIGDFQTVTPSAVATTAITIDEFDFDDYPVVAEADLATVVIPLSGTYTGGVPSDIRARILNAGDSSEYRALAAITITSAAAGEWEGTTMAIPGNGDYLAEVRLGASDATQTQTTTFRTCGAVILYGQSNSMLFGELADPAVTARSDVFMMDRDRNNSYVERYGTPTGGGVLTVLNTLAVETGISWLAVSGGKFSQKAKFLDDVITTGLDDNTDIIDRTEVDLAKLNHMPHAVLYHQGEGDAVPASVGDAITVEYKPAIDDMIETMADVFGETASDLPVIFTSLATLDTSVTGNDDAWATVDDWHFQLVSGTAHYHWGGSFKDAARQVGDNYHPNGTSNTRRGLRNVQAVRAVLGLRATPDVFQIETATRIDATTTRVTFSHGDGTDWAIRETVHGSETPGANTTVARGFTISDGGSFVTATGTRIDATTIDLTHTALGLTGCTLHHLRGAYPDTSGVIVDNSPEAVPLLHTALTPISVVDGVGATAATFNQQVFGVSNTNGVPTVVSPTWALTSPESILVALINGSKDMQPTGGISVAGGTATLVSTFLHEQSDGSGASASKYSRVEVYQLDVQGDITIPNQSGVNYGFGHGLIIVEAKGVTGSWSVLDTVNEAVANHTDEVITHTSVTPGDGDVVVGICLTGAAPVSDGSYVGSTTYVNHTANISMAAATALGDGSAHTYSLATAASAVRSASIILSIAAV